MNTESDKVLWNKFRSGDRSAFKAIYQTEVQYLYNYGRKVFKDSVRTQDAIHDLFVELWDRRDRLGETDCIRKYLTVSMRRKLIATLKKERKLEGDMDGVILPFESTLSIEDFLIQREISEEQSSKLKTAYQTLSNRQKEVLYMRYYQGMNYEQIAEAVGIKYQSIRNLASAAVRGLRTSMVFAMSLVVMMSCSKDEGNSGIGIDDRVLPYFERFETEGGVRGQSVDIRSLSIGAVIESTTDEALGQCVYSERRGLFIRIDIQYWNTANDLEKEFIVFHELGHCFLKRDHDDGRDANGWCTSIMTSGNGSCKNHYNLDTREAYIDELFSIY